MNSSALPETEVLFFDGFDDLDSVAPFEVLVAAGFPVRAVRPPGHPATVRSAHGLQLTVADELGRPGLAIVPGGGWVDARSAGVRAVCEDGALPQRLAALHANGTVLASVCTGAMILAAAGVLHRRPAVTNRMALDDLERSGVDTRREARVVDDGDVVTCGGPAAGLDLAVHLVARFAGETAGEHAALRLEHAPVGQVLVTGAPAAA